MKLKVDYLIIGQGLAGSLLYWFLAKQGKKVFVIDQYHASSASNIAPGIIHPITGRRIVKSWMADILIPFAETTYRELEEQFREKLYFKKNILELIGSLKEQNDWSTKSSSEEMKKYFSDENTDGLYRDIMADDFKMFSVTQSGWLHVSKMIRLFRELLLLENHLLEAEFVHEDVSFKDKGIIYKNIQAEKIIFCEGCRAIQNPYWKHLPFLLSKGEVLTIRAEQLRVDHILSKTITILPIGDNLFRVGSTYSWDELNEYPTEFAKEKLLHKLSKIINVPFEVINHQAGIRPTVKDRRPFIGMHHKQNHVGIFNGLGTKGVLLAPFFSQHYTDYLLGKTNLMEDIDIKRFS